MRNSERFKAFVSEVLNAHDPDRATEFLSPTIADHSLPDGIPGTVEGFQQWFRGFLGSIPDQVWTLDLIVEDGDLVAHQKTVRGTHTGDLFGVPPTGNTIETREVGIARYEDGKIVEFWGVVDDAQLLRQVGALDAVPA